MPKSKTGRKSAVKKALIPRLSITFLVLLALMLVSCPNPPDGQTAAESYTLSGSLIKTGIVDGTYAYLKLVAKGGAPTDATLYWTRSAPYSGGTALYSISGIAEGTYTGYAFIDVNGDAPNSSAAMPGSGDWAAGPSADFVMNVDQTSIDIPEGDWTQMP
jgi:hypothetical protein